MASPVLEETYVSRWDELLSQHSPGIGETYSNRREREIVAQYVSPPTFGASGVLERPFVRRSLASSWGSDRVTNSSFGSLVPTSMTSGALVGFLP